MLDQRAAVVFVLRLVFVVVGSTSSSRQLGLDVLVGLRERRRVIVLAGCVVSSRRLDDSGRRIDVGLGCVDHGLDDCGDGLGSRPGRLRRGGRLGRRCVLAIVTASAPGAGSPPPPRRLRVVHGARQPPSRLPADDLRRSWRSVPPSRPVPPVAPPWRPARLGRCGFAGARPIRHRDRRSRGGRRGPLRARPRACSSSPVAAQGRRRARPPDRAAAPGRRARVPPRARRTGPRPACSRRRRPRRG